MELYVFNKVTLGGVALYRYTIIMNHDESAPIPLCSFGVLPPHKMQSWFNESLGWDSQSEKCNVIVMSKKGKNALDYQTR